MTATATTKTTAKATVVQPVTKFVICLHLFRSAGRGRKERCGEMYVTGFSWNEAKMPKAFTSSTDKTKALEFGKFRAEELLKWTGRLGEVVSISVK